MLEDIKLLPYFINEDLVLLPQDRQFVPTGMAKTEEITSKTAPTKKTAPSPEATSAPATAPTKGGNEEPVQPAAPTAKKEEKKVAVNPNLLFGKNLKELLVLVEDYNHPVMERADGLLLKDILKAMEYTFDDVAIVNISHCREAVDWEAVNAIPYQTLFSFGISHPKIPVTSTLAPYELERSGERKFLLADKLAVLRQDRSRKIALWGLLKKFFV